MVSLLFICTFGTWKIRPKKERFFFSPPQLWRRYRLVSWRRKKTSHFFLASANQLVGWNKAFVCHCSGCCKHAPDKMAVSSSSSSNKRGSKCIPPFPFPMTVCTREGCLLASKKNRKKWGREKKVTTKAHETAMTVERFVTSRPVGRSFHSYNERDIVVRYSKSFSLSFSKGNLNSFFFLFLFWWNKCPSYSFRSSERHAIDHIRWAAYVALCHISFFSLRPPSSPVQPEWVSSMILPGRGICPCWLVVGRIQHHFPNTSS